MTGTRHGSAVIEVPNDLELLITREFAAPAALVFNVLTKPEHVSKWFSPGRALGCRDELAVCTIDLRVGGEYHFVFLTEDGTECSFRGTYLEIERPQRTVETWLFEGRPHDDAVESMDLHEVRGVTTLRNRLTFHDKAARDELTKGGFDGMHASFDRMEDHIRSIF